MALLLAFLAVVAWSSAFVGIRFALQEVSPGTLVLLRFLVASCCFIALERAGRIRWPAGRDVPTLVLIGVLGHAVYQFALAAAQVSITAGMAGVLIALAPALSALLAIPVLGERVSRRAWIGMVVAFGGVLLISLEGDRGFHFEPGILLGLVASAASASYFILQKPWLVRYSAIDLTAYGVWSATLAMLVFAPGMPLAVTEVSLPTALTVAYLGVVPTALAYTLWSLALARAPASKVSSLLYLEPVATFLLGWVILGEIPTPITVLGAICALGGVALVNPGIPLDLFKCMRCCGGATTWSRATMIRQPTSVSQRKAPARRC
ncbi:DMT family transporter [Methylosinus sp. PW1]|uniref:DMT family transporter n=1 Tax=Methylosinus sp. PW1 TaxID=107636 RepID=UPI00068DBD29|nr:DMT family transporter [Methylosinus sp. PW1]